MLVHRVRFMVADPSGRAPETVQEADFSEYSDAAQAGRSWQALKPNGGHLFEITLAQGSDG